MTFQNIDNLKELKSQTLNSIANLTEKTKGTLSETSSNAIATLNQTSEQAKLTLENTLNQADTLTHSVSNSIQSAIVLLINNWFQEHPIIAWMLNHSLITLCLSLFAIFCFLGLIKVAFRGIQKFWEISLKSPFLLGKSLFGLGVQSVGRTIYPKASIVPEIANSEQLNQILEKLEAIQQQLNTIQKI